MFTNKAIYSVNVKVGAEAGGLPQLWGQLGRHGEALSQQHKGVHLSSLPLLGCLQNLELDFAQ